MFKILVGRKILKIVFCLFLVACYLIPIGGVLAEEKGDYLYKIASDDLLEIYVWRNPELSKIIPVRPDGKISSPLIEDIVATGKTPFQLARDIENRLKNYVKAPKVTIIIKKFGLTQQGQVKVIGEVNFPQAIPFYKNISVLDAIIAVKGIKETASGNRSKIIRQTSAGQSEIEVNLSDLIKNGDISQNKLLKPGDILLVPEAWF